MNDATVTVFWTFVFIAAVTAVIFLGGPPKPTRHLVSYAFPTESGLSIGSCSMEISKETTLWDIRAACAKAVKETPKQPQPTGQIAIISVNPF